MRYLLTIPFLFAFGVFAQDEPASNMYWNNYSFFNPAMSGVKYKHEANATYRSQFNDFYNYPEWFANYGVNIKGNHGIGANYVHERTYYQKTTRIKLNYNYQFNLNGNRKIALGAAVNYRRSRLIPWPTICYISTPKKNNFQLDFGAAYYGKNITAGLAITQIPLEESSSFFQHRPRLVGNLRSEGLLTFPWGSLILETRFQTDFTRYQQDFNLGLNIGEFLEFGVGYRTSDALLANLTGIIAKKYRIGYSYAHTINSLSSYNNGRHEFTLGLRIPNN